jgi:hypothetical protein
MNTYALPISVLLLLLFLFAGCEDSAGPEEFDQGSDRIVVTNDPGVFQSRVELFSDDLPLDDTPDDISPSLSSKTAPQVKTGNALDGNPFVLVLRASVDPPELDGVEMRATHVDIEGEYAYVSYNREGATYLGGVEVFDISDPSSPELISQALFRDTDVSALAQSGDNLYLATATSDPEFASPAVLEVVPLTAGLPIAQSTRINLASYVATGIFLSSSHVFVTSGTGGTPPGGLTILDRATLSETSIIELDDARDVDGDGTSLVVMQGTPGRLNLIDETQGEISATYSPGGATIPESKSTIDVQIDRVYMAAGDEGMKVVSLTTGQILYSEDRILLDGVDPGLTVTNAVSVTDDLVLIGNGEAGAYVTRTDGTDYEPQGYVNFGTSVNYLEASDNILFVSAGIGGLKIVELVHYNPSAGSFLTLGDWDDDGVPLYLDGTCSISESLIDAVEGRLDDRKDFRSQNVDVFAESALQSLQLSAEATVSVCFLDDRTGWTNTLGFYSYSSDTPPSTPSELANMTVVYPNASSTNGGGKLAVGDRVELGTFDANSTVGFYLVAQGWHAQQVTSGRYSHYTDEAFNGEGESAGQQQHALLYDETSGIVLLTWEDAALGKGQGKHDFNDVQVLISVDPPSALLTEGIPAL